MIKLIYRMLLVPFSGPPSSLTVTSQKSRNTSEGGSFIYFCRRKLKKIAPYSTTRTLSMAASDGEARVKKNVVTGFVVRPDRSWEFREFDMMSHIDLRNAIGGLFTIYPRDKGYDAGFMTYASDDAVLRGEKSNELGWYIMESCFGYKDYWGIHPSCPLQGTIVIVGWKNGKECSLSSKCHKKITRALEIKGVGVAKK